MKFSETYLLTSGPVLILKLTTMTIKNRKQSIPITDVGLMDHSIFHIFTPSYA